MYLVIKSPIIINQQRFSSNCSYHNIPCSLIQFHVVPYSSIELSIDIVPYSFIYGNLHLKTSTPILEPQQHAGQLPQKAAPENDPSPCVGHGELRSVQRQLLIQGVGAYGTIEIINKWEDMELLWNYMELFVKPHGTIYEYMVVS